jgi:opacity protein-like surface antigen
MKLSAHRAIVISALLLIPALALHAQDKTLQTQPETIGADIYVQAQGGAVHMQDLQVNVGTQEKFKFNTGARADLVVGYKFSRSWSTELDCGVIWNSFDKYGDYSFSASKQADLYQIPIMVNYLYRLPIGHSFEGFLGAGIGAVVTVFHINDSGLNFHDSDVTFGGQGMAGLNYHLSRVVDLSLAYKFLGTTSHKWTDQGFYTQTDGTMSHSLMLGVSVKY